jgi:soluble lytic murein transglycosylase-like protein
MRRLDINGWVSTRVDPAEAVIFYSRLTGSGRVASVILTEARRLDIPLHLAFALAWKESSYNPNAVSRPNKRGTRDWGLFQLNDGGRREWTEEDFFDVSKNAYSALFYLRYCIHEMGSVDMGLAAYNAGVYGVRKWGAPDSTKRYVRSILAYEQKLDRIFNEAFVDPMLFPLLTQ